MSDALEELLDLLDLEQIEVNIFRGRSPERTPAAGVRRPGGRPGAGRRRAARCRRTAVHSLHAYFIRPGDPACRIVYTVDRVRDGRSFTTRRVSAVQHGKAIFTLSASFQILEDGPSHQAAMPDVPAPGVAADVRERLETAVRPDGGGVPRGARSTCGTSTPLTWEAARDPSLTRPSRRSGCASTANSRTTRCCTSA